ncbi:DUF1524 domain-containing protein, partial [Candidatus Dojkabacteria bacterium]|nr:DUF1524 domain-containing protein [Candidatus Dojkabacteria bacterium]
IRKENLEQPVSAEEIEDYYLRNRYGKGDQSYKIVLTKTDKDTLIALLEGKDPPEPVSLRIMENFKFFCDKMAGADLNVVYQGIQKLMIVDVRLQQGIDNPQMIFESMNSTGKALTQADLIRNFVLMGQPHEEQTRLYNDYWRPIETAFGAENYNNQFDEFVRFFLVIKTGNYRIKRSYVYQEFKSYSTRHPVENLLSDLNTYANYYCSIALGKEKDSVLAQVFRDIRELRADVCYPLLMEWYHDYANELLSKVEFCDGVSLVESYVFRRSICDIPTNSMRQTFGTFSRSLKKDRYLESIKATFLLLPSYRRFPHDDEFKRHLLSRNLYEYKRRTYWLRRFENYGRKERVQVQDYTIEHIMPQNKNLSEQWKKDLGDDWQRIHDQHLHTLGNLTLTGYNSEYSDKAFIEKRDMDGGFRHSPLKLNQGLSAYDNWNEDAILDRGNSLATDALKIWQAPVLQKEILEAYREEKTGINNVSQYSIKDHQHLAGGPTLELFEEIRKGILALDECVYEEFLKLYIAYKAETNFVDIVPQARRLRISLNIDFPEIDDPRNLCRDVTNLGKWGNGNVEVFAERIEDIPYIIGLARQALDRQLGEEEEI